MRSCSARQIGFSLAFLFWFVWFTPVEIVDYASIRLLVDLDPICFHWFTVIDSFSVALTAFGCLRMFFGLLSTAFRYFQLLRPFCWAVVSGRSQEKETVSSWNFQSEAFQTGVCRLKSVDWSRQSEVNKVNWSQQGEVHKVNRIFTEFEWKNWIH